MIEVWLVLTLWCDPAVPTCLVEREITRSQISSSKVCNEMADTLPARFMKAVPGLMAVARCEKVLPPDSTEEACTGYTTD